MEQGCCAMMCTLEAASSRTSPASRRRQWRQQQRRRQRHRVQDGVFKKYFNRDPTRQGFLYFQKVKRGFFRLFYVLYSTLLHLPARRFYGVGGYWDRTQDCCDLGINGSHKDKHFYAILTFLKNLRHFAYGATYVKMFM
jgi:hypothetical protein